MNTPLKLEMAETYLVGKALLGITAIIIGTLTVVALIQGASLASLLR